VTGALAALVVICSAVPVQAATGLEPGVHPDPGSPAAKEYALPLNQARRTGEGAATNESSSAVVPFGAGIHPSGSGRSSHPGSGANGNAAQAGHADSGAPPASPSGPGVSDYVPPIVLRSVRSRHASPGGAGSPLALLGGAVAVLVLGGFGGTLIRRSRRPVRPA